VSWEYDSRDTIFTPSRGLLAAVETLFYDPSWGSDTRFETYRAHLYWYAPVGRSVCLGRVSTVGQRPVRYRFISCHT
jgi:hypothetical protein